MNKKTAKKRKQNIGVFRISYPTSICHNGTDTVCCMPDPRGFSAFTRIKKFPIMKGETKDLAKIKSLKDLTLLNRFLFAEAMDDPVNMRNLLEIILDRGNTGIHSG